MNVEERKTTNKDKAVLVLIVLAVIIVIVSFRMSVSNSRNLDKEGIKHKAILVKKHTDFDLKPIKENFYFWISYKIGDKIKNKEIKVSEKKYYSYSVKDSVPILYDKNNIGNIKLDNYYCELNLDQ